MGNEMRERKFWIEERLCVEYAGGKRRNESIFCCGVGEGKRSQRRQKGHKSEGSMQETEPGRGE